MARTVTRLPGAEEAIAPESKVRGYLPSADNSRNQFKAPYSELLGFLRDEWESLASALQEHARRHPVQDYGDTNYGTWYIVEGGLVTPSGRQPALRSVWFLDRGATMPRLTTAYPLPQRTP